MIDSYKVGPNIWRYKCPYTLAENTWVTGVLKKNRSGGYKLPGELLKCVRCFLHLLGLFLPSKVKICQCAGTPS